jgi:formylglycine-generating enzyme required for sulfatase activity
MKNKFLNIAGIVTLGLAIFAISTAFTGKSTFSANNIEWVSIPAGTFTMGSPTTEVNRESNETQHLVTVSAFKMSKYEITFDQYDAFCDATNRKKPSDKGWGRGNRPVIKVSWNDATAFAEWMGCRLPTEAEWEYACRAKTTMPFYTGNNITTAQANYNGFYPYNNNAKGEFQGKTLPVGSFVANEFGLFDMHGNVWEWCSDWYGDFSSLEQTNPKGATTGLYRVFRGGSWTGDAFCCRAACRGYNTPESSNTRTGFRVVFVP